MERVSKLNNIINNSFDILISLVKIGVSRGKEEYNMIKKTCDSERIWNGGVTNLQGSRIDDEETTDTPYDEEFEFVEMHGPSTIIYDGLYDDSREVNVDRKDGE